MTTLILFVGVLLIYLTVPFAVIAVCCSAREPVAPIDPDACLR